MPRKTKNSPDNTRLEDRVEPAVTFSGGEVPTIPMPEPLEEEKPKVGKPLGWRKKYSMTNGIVSADKIFLFVQEQSLPEDSINRFLQLCDGMITTLGADQLNDLDIEEVALFYRDRIYADKMYEIFSRDGAIMDPSMVKQIETLNKSLEVRKDNLGARFKDSGKKRKDKGTMTLLDLFENFQENKDIMEERSKESLEKVKKAKEKFTSTEEYMNNHNQFKAEESKEDD
jgi:hypothetical protein